MELKDVDYVGRFNCRKVIPLVFDDSLSYYEQLLRLKGKINECIENVNIVNDRLDDFNNTVSEKVKNRINELIEDGTIGDVIEEKVLEKIGNLEDLTTEEKDNVVESINEVNAKVNTNLESINNIEDNIDDIEEDVGDISLIDIPDNVNVVTAINSLVEACRDNVDSIAILGTEITALKNKDMKLEFTTSNANLPSGYTESNCYIVSAMVEYEETSQTKYQSLPCVRGASEYIDLYLYNGKVYVINMSEFDIHKYTVILRKYE